MEKDREVGQVGFEKGARSGTGQQEKGTGRSWKRMEKIGG